MTRNPLEARHAIRPNSASRSAKKSRSAEGPVGAKAAGGSEPRTRAASTCNVVPDSLVCPPPDVAPEAPLGIVLSESAIGQRAFWSFRATTPKCVPDPGRKDAEIDRFRERDARRLLFRRERRHQLGSQGSKGSRVGCIRRRERERRGPSP